MPNNRYVLSISVQVYEILNQRDQAIQALKDYIEYGGSLKYLQTMPELSELRRDPRYKQLEKNKDLRD